MSAKPYILQIDLEEKPCLVVGAGPIALHKTRHLVESGAQVTVVSTTFHAGFDDLVLHARHERPFEDADIEGMTLVHAATQHLDVNAHIAERCAAQDILCSVANDSSLGSFGSPALLDVGELRVAISTNGHSPSYGARLRREIAGQLPEYLDEYLAFLGAQRALSKECIPDAQLRMRLNAYLASPEFETLFITLDDEALEEVLSVLLEHPERISADYDPHWG